MAAKRRRIRKRNPTFLRLLCLFAATEFLKLPWLRRFPDRRVRRAGEGARPECGRTSDVPRSRSDVESGILLLRPMRALRFQP